MGSNKTERRKRHRRRYITKHLAKIQALQEQHDHNSTASIVASQDVRVHTVRSSMDGYIQIQYSHVQLNMTQFQDSNHLQLNITVGALWNCLKKDLQ